MVNDILFAFRGLWRNPAFTVVIVASMALGIGANTAMFSAVRAVFLRPLPFPDQDRVVILSESDIASGTTQRLVSPANFVDWRSQSTRIDAMGTLPGWTGTTTSFNVISATGVDRVAGTYASSGFFRALGVRPHIGRLFGNDEDMRSGLRHVLVGYQYWKQHLGSDPVAVGRTIEIDTFRGGKFSIVGVLPEGFEFPKGAQIWLSLGDWGAGPMPAPDAAQRCCPWYAVFAKLKPGVTAEQAATELTTIARRIAQRHPQSASVSEVKVRPLRDHLVASHRLGMFVLFGAVGCILLIVCANVVNLYYLVLSVGVRR